MLCCSDIDKVLQLDEDEHLIIELWGFNTCSSPWYFVLRVCLSLTRNCADWSSVVTKMLEVEYERSLLRELQYDHAHLSDRS